MQIDEFKNKISKELSDILHPSIDKLTKLFEAEQNAIGLKERQCCDKTISKSKNINS